jgi:serine/threonine-protein kinase
VKGLPQEEALEALQEMNVAAEIVLAFSDDVRVGRVISQFPAAQVPFPESSLAVLVVSRGKAPTALPMVALPNVVGKTEFEAGEAIRRAGLEPYSIEAFDLQVPAGRVLGQVPSVESLAAPKAQRRPLWPWVVAASVVLAGAIAFWAWTWISATSPAPKLVGQTQESAIARVNDSGLRLASVVTSAYPDVPPGIVAAQIPSAGTELRRSAEITIVVSSGEALVTLPGVVGRTQADATNELTSVGLTVTVLQSYDNTAVAGTVLGQVPSAGDEVMPGTLVQLNVSRGRPPAAAVAVPAVAGKSQSESESLIKKAKLVAQIYKVYDASVPSGRAIGTLPSSGSRVAKDTTIGLFISLGKPSSTSTDTVTVPNVVGQTQLTAMTSITSGGLAAAVIQQYSDGIPSGTVFNQIPAAGTRVRRGATVGILVSLGPVPSGN